MEISRSSIKKMKINFFLNVISNLKFIRSFLFAIGCKVIDRSLSCDILFSNFILCFSLAYTFYSYPLVLILSYPWSKINEFFIIPELSWIIKPFGNTLNRSEAWFSFESVDDSELLILNLWHLEYNSYASHLSTLL